MKKECLLFGGCRDPGNQKHNDPWESVWVAEKVIFTKKGLNYYEFS